MSVVARAAGLAAVYLLVLTSLDPGDIAVGVAVGLVIAIVLRPRGDRPPAPPLGTRLVSGAAVAVSTSFEVVRGSWRVTLFCLGRRMAPGFVEIPRASRSPGSVALWGLLTGEAPDEVVVDADLERGVLVVHLVDASDPDAVRARHAEAYERRLRNVVA